jgi:hypothetical protein
MGDLRHPSDVSVGSHGSAAKEAKSSSFETASPLDSNTSSSAAAAEHNASLILNEANAFEHTAYNFSNRKKWAVLTVVALCQTSMSKYKFKLRNFITSNWLD